MDDIKYVIKERRKIFYIDVGDIPKERVQQYIDEIKEKYKQREGIGGA